MSSYEDYESDDLSSLSDSEYSSNNDDRRDDSDESPVVVRKTQKDREWSFAIKEHGDFSDYGIVSKISDGKFGDIYKVRNHASGKLFVLKCLRKSQLIKNKMQGQAKQEIENHYIFRHPNIVPMYGFFQDSERLYIVMEYCPGGTLFEKLHQVGRFSEKQAAKYIFQVATALKHIHSRNVIHRDVKLENIILDAAGTCKLSDFGWSTVMERKNDRRTTLCGTLDYLSLEMIESRPYSYDTDVWSLGVLLYELLKGSPPFESKTNKETYAKIEEITYTVPAYFSDAAEDLLDQIFVENDERITINELLRHPWITKNISG